MPLGDPLPGSRPIDPPSLLHFSAKLENGRLVLPADFPLAALGRNAALTVIVESDQLAPVARPAYLRRESLELCAVGETLYTLRNAHRPAGTASVDPALRAYSRAVRTGLSLRGLTYRQMDALWMEIVLLDPLRVSYRAHGRPRLCACRCRVPWLEEEFLTLNAALSAIVRHCEPHRRTATANTFREIALPILAAPKPTSALLTLGDLANSVSRYATPSAAGQLSLPLAFN